MLNAEPEKACLAAKLKWQELGPIKIQDITKLSTIPDIEFNLKYGTSKVFPNYQGQLDNEGNNYGIGRYVMNNGPIYEG